MNVCQNLFIRIRKWTEVLNISKKDGKKADIFHEWLIHLVIWARFHLKKE